jgi:uncharacterized protein YbjT (DUF2867 family)
MATYLVLGASGHTGAVVAQSLLDAKQKVRVLLRDAAKGERWKKRGAEVAVGKADDAHALAAALRGADAAYLLVPPPLPSETGILQRSRRFVDAFLQTVAGSHLKHVVFLSSIGAQHQDTGIIEGLHVAEEALKALKVPFTFLRAGAFMENWTSSLESARGGVLPTFYLPDVKYPQVAAHDIGVVAAGLLSEHPKAHRVVELAGPVDASVNDTAAVLSKLLDTEVKVAASPADQMGKAMQGFGFSAEMGTLFQKMTEGLNTGLVAFEHKETVRRGKETLEVVLGALLKKG